MSAVACKSLLMPRVTAWLDAPQPNSGIAMAYSDHCYWIYVVCDVTIWRHVHVCKPTLWRSLLTQHAYYSTRTLLTRCCTMCHCNEYKLSAFQVRRPKQNTALNAKTEQFITAKLTGNALTPGLRSRSRKESKVFGWTRIPDNTGSRSRTFLSDSDCGCQIGSFLHHTPKLGILVEMIQFLLKLLLKQRFLAMHHDFYWS